MMEISLSLRLRDEFCSHLIQDSNTVSNRLCERIKKK